MLLTACTTLGPDFVKPTAPVEEKWIEPETPQIKTEPGDHSAWWKVLKDPVLDKLIEMASEQNLSLQIAGLRILESRALLGIAVGLQYPQVQQLNGGYTYLKSSKNVPPLSSLPDDVNDRVDRSSDVYQFGFDAAWELDFWGKFRRSVEAADASLAASIAGYDNLLVILTGEVAAAYVVIRTLEQRLKFARGNVGIQQRSLKIAEVRFKGGATSELDVQQARSLLRNTQALIPVLEISIRQAKHGLSVLLGIPPSDLPELLEGPSVIPKAPTEVAVGIPADLLRRRPDIRLAEFQAATQGALIGVAKADLYPHFALGGSIGFSADSGSDLFDSDSVTGFFTPFAFRWDIFNYGRIKNKVRVQDARFEQQLVSYQNKVLQAAKEVEDALVGFVRSQRQAQFLVDGVNAAQRASDLALLQYKEGLIDYTPVLNTQQVLVSQQDSLATSRGDIVRYLIALYKALGGGWQIRIGKDIIPEQTAETMRNRTDWGELLQPVSLPEETEPPPTGQDVKLLHKPKW
jgi:NodT family efflux transporter outer membrane factor (OMF) lipoprotein